MSEGTYPNWPANEEFLVQIGNGNTNSVDAFGRLRVSTPITSFSSKQIHDNEPLLWDEALESGAGITTAHSTDTASTVFTSTVSTAGVFTRQTFQRFHYQSGKGQLILWTGIIQRDASGAGVQRQSGFFDDENGLFFRDNAGTMQVVRRTSVTGTPVDNPVNQEDWNCDKMDGKGPSGIIADWSKNQLFFADFQWLGTGRVRMGLEIAGQIHTVHEFNAANELDKVWASTPDLPVRHQMITTADSPAVTMEAICAAVSSEAGFDSIGASRYFSTAGTAIAANTANLIYVVVGMRLQAAKLDSQVSLEVVSMVNGANSDFEWMLLWNPTIAGGGITFGDVANSRVQVGVGEGSSPSTTTATLGTLMAGGFVAAGNSAGSTQAQLRSTIKLGAAIDGTRDEIYLCVRPLANNATMDGGLGWREA